MYTVIQAVHSLLYITQDPQIGLLAWQHANIRIYMDVQCTILCRDATIIDFVCTITV